MIEIGMMEEAIFLPVFSPLAIIDDMARGKPSWVIVINKLYVGITREYISIPDPILRVK